MMRLSLKPRINVVVYLDALIKSRTASGAIFSLASASFLEMPHVILNLFSCDIQQVSDE